jgi:hypothetical protein
VKIYLLAIDRRRFFFFADASDDSRGAVDDPRCSSSSAPGLLGRLHDRFQKLKAAWEHSDALAARGTRGAWIWLHSWAHPDESMLVRLRSAARIDVYHPASRPDHEVRALWGQYLNHRWWRHLSWLGVNALIAPFTVLFAILPGPNVIGYWFAYRAVHHALIVWGIWRVRAGRSPTELYPLRSLDRPIELDQAGRAKHDALDGAPALLDEHVAWSESESSGWSRRQDQLSDAGPGDPVEAGSEES